MLSAKEALNKRDLNYSMNIPNLNQSEKQPNNDMYININNHQSPLNKINSSNNANYRNDSMEVKNIQSYYNLNNKNNNAVFNNSEVSNFHINENSSYSVVEKKNKIFKSSSMPRNLLFSNNNTSSSGNSNNKQNVLIINSKLAKNNYNNGIEMSPLKGSFKIEKSSTPVRSKPSNQSLTGHNNLSSSFIQGKSSRNIVNAFNLNGAAANENKFSYSIIKNNNNNSEQQHNNVLENKLVDMCISNSVFNLQSHSAVLNQEDYKNYYNVGSGYGVERFKSGNRSLSNQSIRFNKSDIYDNLR